MNQTDDAVNSNARFCPSCGNLLKWLPSGSGGSMCGGILRYKCPKCKKFWEENQMGMAGSAINLKQISRFLF